LPRIRYHVAASLDGYIAGPNGEFDWITHEPSMDFRALFAQFDTFVVGRRTFELMLRPDAPPRPAGTKTFVFSRTLPDTVPVPTTSVVREVSAATVAPIKAQAKKDIWLFGGGELFRSFLDAGLVDTVEVAVSPVLLGKALQFLAQPAAQARLRLTSHHVYPSGVVSLDYSIVSVSSTISSACGTQVDVQ
jgi:dihydrofolate reductase